MVIQTKGAFDAVERHSSVRSHHQFTLAYFESNFLGCLYHHRATGDGDVVVATQHIGALVYTYLLRLKSTHNGVHRRTYVDAVAYAYVEHFSQSNGLGFGLFN
jgi:hypothetical protein